MLPVAPPEAQISMPHGLARGSLGVLAACFSGSIVPVDLDLCTQGWSPALPPELREVLILREPRDVVVSAFFMSRYVRNKRPVSPPPDGDYRDNSSELELYVAAHYLPTLAWTAVRWHWLSKHYAERTHMICYSTLKRNTAAEATRLLRFMGFERTDNGAVE